MTKATMKRSKAVGDNAPQKAPNAKTAKIDKQSSEIKPRTSKGGSRPGSGRPAGARNKVTLELQEAAQAYTGEALETLHRICINGESESARVSAACALLDRAHGKPKQQIDMNVDGPQYVVGVERLPNDEEFERKYSMGTGKRLN